MENAQPLVINYVKGTLAIAHNGNWSMRLNLEKNWRIQVLFSRRRLTRK